MIHLKRLYAHNFKQLQEIELHFPEHARILVQGKNEAGKSTLFEAVFFALFGTALATETGSRSLDDLIRYEVEKAAVELDLQFDGRVFKIKRTIVRGKSNTWELDIDRDGQLAEEIRGNMAVNKRLIAELGFDGDALLNTCFVEQKKLEKLEGLSKSKREESLAKLLNLDKLVQIEGDLKVGAEDRRELDRLKKRADLAAIQSELPTYETELAKTEEKLTLIDLRGAVDGAVTEMRAVDRLDTEVRALAAQRDQVAQRVERVDAIKQAMVNVKEARDAIERVNDQTREIERLKQDQADAQRAATQIPELRARIVKLQHLGHQLQRLGQVRAAGEKCSQRVQQIDAMQARVADLNATITREEQSLAQAENALRQHEIDLALDDWMVAKRETTATTRIEDAVTTKRVSRDRIAQRLRIELYIFVAALIAFGAAAAIAESPIVIFAIVAMLIVALALRASRLWRDLSRAAEELGQAEGEARTRTTIIESQQARLAEVEARLAKLNVVIPETIEDAQANHSTHPKLFEELRDEQNAARERLTNARAVLGELTQQSFDSAQDALAGNIQAERSRSGRAAQKADHIIAQWQPRVQAIAKSLNVAAEANAVQRAQIELQSQIESVQRRANDATRLNQDIARREQQIQSLLSKASESYQAAQQIAVKSNRPAWNTSFAIDDYTAFGKDLRAEYDVLGGDTAGKQLREIEGDLGRKQGEKSTREKNVDVLKTRIQQIFPSFPSGPSESTTRELKELVELREKLSKLELGDEATLRIQHRELVGRVRSLSDRQTQLERDLGLAGQELDRATAQAEWEQKVRESLVRERGVEIAATARRRIVQKILPATMDYMRQILPTLTRDRYHDAQLDPETYKIQVWDERAGQGNGGSNSSHGGAFKEKNIFSGGTKDQFSLALRLAFALATLPRERGSAPAFIFLDEPLGSFDDERADALIYLLTEGEIARAFDQIFLISHVHINERMFTHHLVLENGRVAESDLPNE